MINTGLTQYFFFQPNQPFFGLAQLAVCGQDMQSQGVWGEAWDPGPQETMLSGLTSFKAPAFLALPFHLALPTANCRAHEIKEEQKQAAVISVDFSLSRLLYGLKNFSPFFLYSGAHWSLANRWYQTFPSLCYGRPMEAYLFEAFMQIIAYCPIRS